MRLFELLEALSQDQAKKYLKLWNEEWSDKIYEPIFGTKWRIYIPLESESADATSPTRDKIAQYLQSIGYSISSYRGNLAVDDRGRERKIGKLLSPELLKLYQEDPVRKGSTIDKNTTKYQIVISRHPYDIAGMSTDRGWKSCMTLTHTDRKTGEEVEAGCNQHIVEDDVKAGTLIAYLLAAADRNIENPKARMLIKPYYSASDGLLLSTKASQVYGDAPPLFKSTVDSWTDDANEKLEVEAGEYNLPDSLYNDYDDDEVEYDGEEYDTPGKISYAGSTSANEKHRKINTLRKLKPDNDPEENLKAVTEIVGPVTYNTYAMVNNKYNINLALYIPIPDEFIIQLLHDNPKSVIDAWRVYKNRSPAVRRAIIDRLQRVTPNRLQFYELDNSYYSLMTPSELVRHLSAMRAYYLNELYNADFPIPIEVFISVAEREPAIVRSIDFKENEIYQLMKHNPGLIGFYYQGSLSPEFAKKLVKLHPDNAEYVNELSKFINVNKNY
jgi:hypothetical protein